MQLFRLKFGPLQLKMSYENNIQIPTLNKSFKLKTSSLKKLMPNILIHGLEFFIPKKIDT